MNFNYVKSLQGYKYAGSFFNIDQSTALIEEETDLDHDKFI